MKSNQRREAKQLDQSKVLWSSMQNLTCVQDQSNHSLLTQSSCSTVQRQQEIVVRSKIMNRLGSNHECCAIIDNKGSDKYPIVHQLKASSSPLHSLKKDTNIKQTMYIMTKRRSESNKRASIRLTKCRSRHTTSVTKILNGSLSNMHRQTFTFVVISLALTSCILINQIQALSTSSAPDSADSSQNLSSAPSLQSSLSSSVSSSSSASSPSLASSVASSALSSLSSAIISAALQDGKSSSSDRSNSQISAGSEVAPTQTLSSGSSQSSSLASPSTSSSSTSDSSAPSSLAASLSSAVASAAAAAAVAAAQNSLSGGDARSLLTSSNSMMLASNNHQTGSRNHHQQSRNPGLHLALKLADAIPEVPYNILHNMKKLDHAAPFYNVGNKVSYTGNSKESTHGLLASALHASGGLGGATEQLMHLFRSPIWKRIADGYGEFTSEFRSLFRAPPNTMKGPTNPTTKLLRDLSVPALLMILASTIPSDWRPVRTRRKSLIPSDLTPSYSLVDPMIASASSELPNYSPSPRLYGSLPNFNMGLQQQQQVTPQQQIGRELNPLAQMYSQFDQSASPPSQARTNDVNLNQPTDVGASTVAWMQQPLSQTEQRANQLHNYDTQMHQIQLHQHPQQQQQQSSIKRFGDSLLSALNVSPASDLTKFQLIHSDSKLANGERLYSNNLAASSNPSQSASSGGLFSSLTSSLAHQVGQSKLMSRLRNANVASSGFNSQPTHDQRVASSIMNNEHKMSSASRDNLDDRHRYSMADNDNMLQLGNSLNEQQQKLSPTKPFLLSAMTQALGSVLANSFPLESGSSTDHGIISRKMFTLNGNNEKSNHNTLNLFGDKSLDQHDSILRRNHQASGAMEQRELSKLIPQSWRQVVKRTVNSVHEQATTQWRSIEGQLTNWVQDKLKTFPAATGATSSGSASSTATASSSSTPSAPVANIFASVGSTALNILGLGPKSQAGGSTASSPANAVSNSLNESASSDESQATTSVIKNKNDSTSKPKQPTAKGALVGVANMIVNTLANRQNPSTQSVSKSKTPVSSDEASSSGNLVSQYPTLTGVQVGSSQSPSPSSVDSASPSIASGTASTIL